MEAVAGARRAGAVRAVPAGLLLICLGLASAVSAQTLDDRVYAVARQLMCPVCQGQTVAESDSALAGEMKVIIRQKLEAGETPDQILRYFAGQNMSGSAELLGLSLRSTHRLWAYAKAWLLQELERD